MDILNTKKANLTGVLVTVVLLIFIVVAIIPVFIEGVESADNVFSCDNADYPVLDEDYNLCTNTSGVGVYNESPTDNGISSGNKTILILGVTFLILGVLTIVVKKTGLTSG